MTVSPAPLGAVILTGGTGLRLGGVDKAALEVDGRTMLDRALEATAAADPVVVVGPATPTRCPVTWTRENPPGGGPAAGLLAGLDALPGPVETVCVLAVDMPRFTARTMHRLVAVLKSEPDTDAACLVDPSGRQQWLAGVYRLTALTAARPADPADEDGMSMRALVRDLRIAEVTAVEDEAHDVDTWDDLAQLTDLGTWEAPRPLPPPTE